MTSGFATPAALLDFVKTSLQGHHHRKGKIFYSGFGAYLRGKVIFLGYNPGGMGDQTLDTRLASYPPGEFNHFLDERWRKKGEEWVSNTLQRRSESLFKQLGFEMRTEVFTSNLYFTHTITAQELNHPDFLSFKLACWPVIRHLLLAVPACVVLCNSHQTFYELVSFIGGGKSNEELFQGIRHSTSVQRQSLLLKDLQLEGKDLRLIGFPHLSRFSTAVREAARIKSWIAGAAVKKRTEC